MRLSGKRFADKYVRKKIRPTNETLDGIIFEVDWNSYVCKCKVQGSDEYINAYFPRNEATIPSWMKPGNAVRLLHRAGVRGHTEVIGHGGAIPTPMPGSPWRPETSALADGILTGCEMSVVSGTMSVYISAGTFRIGGSTYSATMEDLNSEYMNVAGLVTMNDVYSPMVMGGTGASQYTYMQAADAMYMTTSDDIYMGAVAEGIYTIDDAPAAGYFRYDAFVVGADGVVDYLKGTEASSNPSKPEIPANHILLGQYIFVIGGITELKDEYLGQEWTARQPVSITITELDEEWEFDLGNDYPTINVTVNVYDQYGWAMSLGGNVTLEMVVGTGLIYSGDSGWDASSVEQYVGGSGYSFTYQRDQTSAETSPSFLATTDTGMVSNLAHITLLDRYGNPVAGGSGSDIQTLTSAASVSIDCSSGYRASVVAAHDITFSFSGANDFDKLILEITQDGIGGRTMSWPSNIRYGDEITEIIISTAANSTSYVGFIYHATSGKYDVVANVSGYL